ncbi:MAG: AraC family transcriptional regulator [Bacteroidota bacterium]
MSLLDFYYYVNTLTFYSILLCVLFVWKNRKKVNNPASAFFFLICIGAYLMFDEIENIFVERFLVIGAFLVPVSLWIFSRSIFDGKKIPARKRAISIAVSLVPYLSLYFPRTGNNWIIISVLSASITVFFIVMTLAEIPKRKTINQEQDKLKKIIVCLVAFIILFNVISDILFSGKAWLITVVIERLLTLSLTNFVIFTNFAINYEVLSKKKTLSAKDPVLVDKLQTKMIHEKLYLAEKLTIGQLAEQIDEQEYKVRRAINQELGFKNFLDFVNSFRIKEAAAMLEDASKANLSILQIAYQTGFNSIAPFNRAFKLYTGMTPTTYRKSRSHPESNFSPA